MQNTTLEGLPSGRSDTIQAQNAIHPQSTLKINFNRALFACTETSPESCSKVVSDVTTEKIIGNERRRQAAGNTCGGVRVGMVGNSCQECMHCEYGWDSKYIQGSQFHKLHGSSCFQCSVKTKGDYSLSSENVKNLKALILGLKV